MRMGPYQLPEPSQASWPVGVLMPGPGFVPGLVPVLDLHNIQDAWIIRLQHVNNSHPGATANRAQRTQAAPASLVSRRRHRSVRKAAGGTGAGRPR